MNPHISQSQRTASAGASVCSTVMRSPAGTPGAGQRNTAKGRRTAVRPAPLSRTCCRSVVHLGDVHRHLGGDTDLLERGRLPLDTGVHATPPSCRSSGVGVWGSTARVYSWGLLLGQGEA